MRETVLFGGLAAIVLGLIAVDYFLLIPRGDFGPISQWMLMAVAVIGIILAAVLVLIAGALAARQRSGARSSTAKSTPPSNTQTHSLH